MHNKKQVLIIGGTGYVGSALYRHLTSYLSYDVTTMDLEWFGNNVNLDNIIQDFRYVTSEQLARFDVVVLLAAHSTPSIANRAGAVATFSNNVDNFFRLINKISPTQRFIYASSAVVYDGIQDENVTEDYPLHAPSNIYDASKQDIDTIASRCTDVESYGLRFGSVNGISPNFRTDVIVNVMTDNAMTSGEVRVFAPELKRSILSIKDLCAAIKSIIDSHEDHRGIYNMTSFNSTVGEIAHTIADITEAKLVSIDPNSFGDTAKFPKQVPYNFSMSSEKFQKTFNFVFQDSLSNIVRGIRHAPSNIIKNSRLKTINYDV